VAVSDAVVGFLSSKPLAIFGNASFIWISVVRVIVRLGEFSVPFSAFEEFCSRMIPRLVVTTGEIIEEWGYLVVSLYIHTPNAHLLFSSLLSGSNSRALGERDICMSEMSQLNQCNILKFCKIRDSKVQEPTKRNLFDTKGRRDFRCSCGSQRWIERVEQKESART
jgi:hypothetical protein